MKSRSVIRAIGSNTLYNDKMLVDFVTRNLSSKEGSPDDSLPVNCASTAIPVKGKLEITFEDFTTENIVRIGIPVDSLFFITCTKDETGACKVAWNCSLS
jgi:hypothetical protein